MIPSGTSGTSLFKDQPLSHHHDNLRTLPIKARRHPLVPEIRRRLTVNCAYDGSAGLILGVSGGVDSVSLLIAAHVLDLPVTAVHVHHHLRADADADAEHVERLCASMQIPLQVTHVQPASLPGNVPANARKLRYDALRDAAERAGARFVAVAHHAEDQLETMIMALCRGSGLSGLSAMRWTRPLGEATDLLRPMLAVRKADCVALCEAAGVSWREDSSNVDISKARVAIRTNVVPVLERLWPDSARRAAATADLVAAADVLLDQRVAAVFGTADRRQWQRDELRSEPTPILAAGLRRSAIDIIGHAPDDLGQRQLLPAAEAIVDEERRPREFELTSAVRVTVRANTVQLLE